MRKSNPRVPRRALDDRPAGAEEASFLGVEDDVQGGAVFDAAAGVLELGFAEDVAGGLVGERGEVDQGRVADGAAEARDGALGGGDAEVVGVWGAGHFGGGVGGGGVEAAGGTAGEEFADGGACWRRHGEVGWRGEDSRMK